MSDLDHILETVVGPGLALLPSRMDAPAARVLLMAIGLQESRFEYRRQIGGPARGYFQFEQGGGVAGVLRHRSSAGYAADVCKQRGVAADAATVYRTLEHDDLLACAFARLLLWTDPAILPHPGYGAASWAVYLRTWRPGAYTRGDEVQRTELRAKWDRNYKQALEALA